jgi:hypothetical protein
VRLTYADGDLNSNVYSFFKVSYEQINSSAYLVSSKDFFGKENCICIENDGGLATRWEQKDETLVKRFKIMVRL